MITLFDAGPFREESAIALGDDAAHHARVRRAQLGDRVRLLDGTGHVAEGTFAVIGKREVSVAIERVADVPRPTPLAVIVPVADKERMLLAAEKCVELQVTAWHPVYFARSRSVAGRGEGERFREKLLARMQSALEQSGGAWLPEVNGEVDCADAWGAVLPEATRLILRADGQPISSKVANGPMAIAVGPEGGFERAEVEAAEQRGWLPASLGSGTLRFETAVVAGTAVIRAMQLTSR